MLVSGILERPFVATIWLLMFSAISVIQLLARCPMCGGKSYMDIVVHRAKLPLLGWPVAFPFNKYKTTSVCASCGSKILGEHEIDEPEKTNCLQCGYPIDGYMENCQECGWNWGVSETDEEEKVSDGNGT
jgi:DNA-directed RNA polymerase subunit RPC12/RpoP